MRTQDKTSDHSDEHMVQKVITYGKLGVKVRKGQNLGPCYDFKAHL